MMVWVGWIVALCVVIAVSGAAYLLGHKAAGCGYSMARWVLWVAVGAGSGACLLGAFYGGYRLARSSVTASDASGGDAANTLSATGTEPVVPVSTVAIRRGVIRESITAYGRVVAQPGQTRVLSVPFQSVVQRSLVTAGEEVGPGTPLMEVVPSSTASTQLSQAQEAAQTARTELKQIEDQYRDHLAVNTQLESARQTYRSAQLNLERLRKEGVGKRTTLTASASGIVSQINVKEGQMVAPGTPLLDMALGDRIEVKLGVEPEDIPNVHVGDAVELTAVHLDPGLPVSGRVRLVTHEVNPTTALVEVFISLPPNSGLTLFAYVRATLTATAQHALVVPTEAVLPGKEGYRLFTVHEGRAVRHIVHLGLETDTEVQIEGDGIEPGELAVLAGNYELKPGMAVSARKSAQMLP